MEVLISNSSLRLPAIFSRHCKGSLPNKPTTKYIKSADFPLKCSNKKLIQPIGLYGENRTPKSLLFGSQKLNFIQARAELGKDQHEAAGPNSKFAKVLHFGSTCYKFIRPYAMLQVIVSSVSFFARVLVENPQLFKWSLLLKAFPGLIAMILAHSYTYGINQIFDADIDRVNKPYLPIPAGDFSLTQAWFLMTFFVLAGQIILRLMNADPITTCLYCFGLLLATMYSAPPFRLKGSAIATIITIPLSTIINNVGVIYATMASLGLPFRLSPPVVFILTFNALFFVVTCLIKDIEDVQGDMRHNIQTFAAMFGPKNMTLLGMGILLVNYIGAFAVAIYMPQAFKWHIIFPAHSILILWLLFQARKLDKANYVKEASANFYQFLWKLLTLEFLLVPFI
uniref:Oxyresveratrol geranyltransferase n=1 Tax=Morus alba TaxID=3498 RepID=A0A346FHM8_MORAL|nr:oxyresveratrol geranyltransferase [Morus alba]